MLQYVVLIITLEVCVDSSNCQIETNLQVYAVHDVKPWESRVVGRYLDGVAGWGRSLDAFLVAGKLSDVFAGSSEGRSNFHGFLGTLHGQRAADGRLRCFPRVAVRSGINQPKNSKCQIFFFFSHKNCNISAPAGSIFFKF